MRRSHSTSWYPKPKGKGEHGVRAKLKGPDTMSAGKQRRAYGPTLKDGLDVSWDAFVPHTKNLASTDVRPLKVCVKDGNTLRFAPVDRKAADLVAQATELLDAANIEVPAGQWPAGKARRRR